MGFIEGQTASEGKERKGKEGKGKDVASSQKGTVRNCKSQSTVALLSE